MDPQPCGISEQAFAFGNRFADGLYRGLSTRPAATQASALLRIIILHHGIGDSPTGFVLSFAKYCHKYGYVRDLPSVSTVVEQYS